MKKLYKTGDRVPRRQNLFEGQRDSVPHKSNRRTFKETLECFNATAYLWHQIPEGWGISNLAFPSVTFVGKRLRCTCVVPAFQSVSW